VVYDISVAGERVLLMGSLNLDRETEYPVGADLLIMPLQGRSDIAKYAMKFLERLRPKRVLVDHCDDAFPPISSRVDTGRFAALMNHRYPDVAVLCPQAGVEWMGVG
jgi:L-ascorbate metabolism protein UlaG (beta-lactamase superfamily)